MKHLMVFIYPDAASVNEMVYASDLNKDGLLDFSEFERVSLFKPSLIKNNFFY